MYYIIIDCGTTNSRAYVVDASGTIYGVSKKKVGVRDTSITGSRDTLRRGLKEIVKNAVKEAGLSEKDIGAILSSGMITSEIGLMEIPHADAPAGIDTLAETVTKVEDMELLGDVPVYFVRGIRNPVPQNGERPTSVVGVLDFMRGEETQMIGVMKRKDFTLPAMVVVLSSHTKFVPIDENDMILGSLSTISGQLFDCVMNGTFIHKSVIQGDSREERPEDYFDEKIVDDAIEWDHKVGLARACMFPRFLDVLLDTKWYERMLFYDALITAEDTMAINQLDMFHVNKINNYYLIGAGERCRLYDYILHKLDPDVSVTAITDSGEIDNLSIAGMIEIMKKAGIVNE